MIGITHYGDLTYESPGIAEAIARIDERLDDAEATAPSLADWRGQRAILRRWTIDWCGGRSFNLPGLRRVGSRCVVLRAHYAMRYGVRVVMVKIRFRDGRTTWCYADDLSYAEAPRNADVPARVTHE